MVRNAYKLSYYQVVDGENMVRKVGGTVQELKSELHLGYERLYILC